MSQCQRLGEGEAILTDLYMQVVIFAETNFRMGDRIRLVQHRGGIFRTLLVDFQPVIAAQMIEETCRTGECEPVFIIWRMIDTQSVNAPPFRTIKPHRFPNILDKAAPTSRWRYIMPGAVLPRRHVASRRPVPIGQQGGRHEIDIPVCGRLRGGRRGGHGNCLDQHVQTGQALIVGNMLLRLSGQEIWQIEPWGCHACLH